MQRYNPKDIEPKWQKQWAKSNIYKAVDFDTRRKYTVLTEFPYPSGDGLHLGHTREYALGDVMARHKRMQGYNVLYPMGYDAFGLPTENYAIKNKVTPQAATNTNVNNFQRQFGSLGFSIDWDRSFRTSDPEYYKWTQWLFLQFFKAGLAFQDEIAINWCPFCKTGLANEEVVNGRHERCDTLVEKKQLKQWLLRITDYAERLIEGLKDVDYPSRIADQQINWIGRSQGVEVDFAIDGKQHFVLLHGYTADSQKNFHPWLKKELEAKGHSVEVLDLPNTDKPDAKEQAAYVLEHATIDENTTILGHSYGSVTALRVLEQLDTPIKQLVLVAGFVQGGFLDKERNFENTTDWEFDFAKIKDSVKDVLILRATNDIAVPQERSDELQEKLDGKIVDFKAEANHACGEQEPKILESILPQIKIFTTRPDTLFGATFMVLAPEHPLVQQITTDEHKANVNSYVKAAAAKSEIERQDANRDKTGVNTGAHAVNPVNGSNIPIWIADYVLTGYGTGAIMAVPAHDERDWEFAKQHDLPIKRVISNDDPEDEASAKDGTMINSGDYDGLPNREAGEKIVTDLQARSLAESKVNYRLRDWVFSRQHYWGEPIPIIHCDEHGAVPVPDDQLPVKLPKVDNYEPTDTGESPLAAIADWVNTTCPTCGKPAKRETDTMPNWAGSSWYYLRYYDAHNDQAFADKKKLEYWGAVDMYLGGMEHTTLHLLYSRFWHQFFYDQGLVPTPEPYAARRGQGIILAADGSKMSKSKGNVVNPSDIIDSGYGADALRLAILFLAPYDQTTPWSPEGVAGTHRFLQRVWTLVQEFNETTNGNDESAELTRVLHKTIKKVSEDLEKMSFNTAIAALMECVNELYKIKADKGYAAAEWQWVLQTLQQLLAPFAPHISEELWQQLGRQDSVHTSEWPEYNEQHLVEDSMTIVVQVNGRVRGEISIASGSDKDTVIEAAQANEKVAGYLKDQAIKKTIYVPNKLVNFVI